MKTKELKKQILESIIILVSEGEQLSSYSSGNFSEFAKCNGYPLHLVEEVYYNNVEEIEKYWSSPRGIYIDDI